MEHFLPLAIASMVISLISIILLDHFGPSTVITSEPNQISDPNEAKDATNKVEDSSPIDETNVENPTELPNPFNSVVPNKKVSPPTNLLLIMGDLAIY